jgi:hypothetical protein
MSEPTIIYQSSETQYWYDEGGSMLCQYKPELWREGYSSETFGVSMNETELVTALTLATQRAEAAEAERDAELAAAPASHDALIIAEGQRDQARAERDALRKLLRMCARTCDTLDHGPGKDFHESDEMCPIVVRIDAALAVQPTTGAAHE